MEDALINISKAAIEGNRAEVRRLLSEGVNYRTAYIYVERFFQDKKASKLIIDEGLCKCGFKAINWKKEPMCADCLFQIAMDEYSNIF